jgi:hypothetical protein
MGKKFFPYSKLWGNKFVQFEEYIGLGGGRSPQKKKKKDSDPQQLGAIISLGFF